MENQLLSKMDDPIGSHPTRAEQLDILVSAIADQASNGDRLLDLGCGTGYTIHLLEQQRHDLQICGVDFKPESLAAASDRFGYAGDRMSWVEGNLKTPNQMTIPAGDWQFIISCLTFHDLNDGEKAALLKWASDRLAENGVILIYDRIRLTEPTLFDLQRSIWSRIERIHGRGMRSAETFDRYVEDLGTDNRPATLSDYGNWFADLGLVSTPLHIHGNVALIAASHP